MSLNKESTTYTFIFLAVMGIAVAITLAFLNETLKGKVKENEKFDTQRKISKSVIESLPIEPSIWMDLNTGITPDQVVSEYKNITAYMINSEAEQTESIVPDVFNLKAELKKPIDDRELPIYEYKSGDIKYYIFQMIGLGLWDEISGYICLHDDLNTIRGISFDHKGETPGLGADIVKNKFTDQFAGKKIFDENGNYNFTAYKAGKYKGDEYGVDGVSGATLTIDGVHYMIEDMVENYASFFEKNKK